MDPKLDKYSFTVTDAVRELGVTTTYIYRLLSEGRFDALKRDKKWAISRASVMEFKRKMLGGR
jgi:excisionase family DNA binding protein